MPTVPNLPAASTVASTDHLWLTQGTGASRDKKATVSQVVDAGHKALAFGDASAVAATDKLFLVQGTGASKDKMATVVQVVDGAMSSAINAWATSGLLAGSEFVPLRDDDGTMLKISAFSLNRRMSYDFPSLDVTLVKYGSGGTDVLLSTVTADPSRVDVAYDMQLAAWDVLVNIRMAPAATQHYPVVLSIPVSAFPEDLEEPISDVTFPALPGVFLGNLMSSVCVCTAIVSAGAFLVTFLRVDGSALYWDDIANSSGNLTLCLSGRAFA